MPPLKGGGGGHMVAEASKNTFRTYDSTSAHPTWPEPAPQTWDLKKLFQLPIHKFNEIRVLRVKEWFHPPPPLC